MHPIDLFALDIIITLTFLPADDEHIHNFPQAENGEYGKAISAAGVISVFSEALCSYFIIAF